ncbi:MAG: acetate--CoA ligase family protein, partial [Candidatus Bathyarchaeia archaeon]
MKKTSQIIAEATKEGRKHLLENEAKTICMEYNIPVTEFKLAKSMAEAVKAAGEIGFPVVLKIVSPDIIHKSDVGGVMLNLKNAREVRAAYKQIMENVKRHKKDAKIIGVIVQEMAQPSTEVIVGAIKDPQFGPTLMFGIGG